MRPVALVTEVGSELGRAVCRAGAFQHAIVGVHRSAHPGVASQHERPFDPFVPARPLEAPIWAVKADLGEASDVRRVLEIVEARHGRLDTLVHTAWSARTGHLLGEGAARDAIRSSSRMSIEAMIDTTLEAARSFWRERRGPVRRRVVCVLPEASAIGRGAAWQALALGAIEGILPHLRAELAPLGVVVDVVRHRAGHEEETARAVFGVSASGRSEAHTGHEVG